MRAGTASGYQRIADKIAADQVVVLDGGTATELHGEGDVPGDDEGLWGTRALVHAPDLVRDVHRRYAAAGCDVISTNTWGLPSALRVDGPQVWESTQPVHWMDVARRGLSLVREAIEAEGRAGECAVAFSLNGEVDSPDGQETVRLLARPLEEEPPDLILVETLSLIGPSIYVTVETLLETGLPVWLSFRRCRHGVCGVYGQHWGGPEGDLFGRAARRFEEMGVGALLVNCIPPDHVTGMVSWLRDFTDMPLGVYPNLGYLTNDGWRSDRQITGDEYAQMALEWREEGAQIVGGCCGVGPELIAAASERLADTKPGTRRPEPLAETNGAGPTTATPVEPVPWRDLKGRDLFPLPLPQIAVDEGVFVPTQGSFLAWRHLFEERLGNRQRCLDVGCGCGILTVQLALNGAAHVHAIDIEERAVANTMANAFRNGVSDRVSGAAVDLYPWVPEEPYELIVASLYQMPVDPGEQVSTHRPLDYWGRNLLDHLITLLPEALAEDGVAYLLHLSILSHERTAALLAEHGFEARVVDYSFFELTELFQRGQEHIKHVEDLTDAYHLRFGDQEVMVAYLLEVRRRN
ncbi:MAG TPA: homocysteine S-methyltransferase family protein [Thermoleophilaceae bacterium]|jgi:S-methylmethionine-dependent homocysteine/selenocysteine methylase/SAM-dependent methyltransferase|nr:homocysteine S-methyltransferase family protein [Thermoleophilaceae bacterium]